jgi:hypothetical protein
LLNPITLPLAAMTLMLWIIWSDSVRPRRPSRVVYGFRIIMFATVVGLMIYNTIVYPRMYGGGIRVLIALATIVAVAGIVYFVQKLRTRPRNDFTPHP